MKMETRISPGHLTAQAARAWALKQTWAAVAQDWEINFLSIIYNKKDQCDQCGAVVEGHHTCPGVPGWEYMNRNLAPP